MTKPDPHASALRVLRRRDPRLAAIIDRIGPYTPRLTPNPFYALTGAIVHQQVSMIAARAMLRRLRERCPTGRLSPRSLTALTDDDFAAAGISRQKRGYLRDLAAHFASRRVTAAALRRMDDEQVVEAVTAIKGVGRWTAEMLLIFCLHRPDVWPADDLGLRKAVARLLGREELPANGEMQQIGEKWRPYRTYATWYLWRSLEPTLESAIT